jgi:hypothetical protein
MIKTFENYNNNDNNDNIIKNYIANNEIDFDYKTIEEIDGIDYIELNSNYKNYIEWKPKLIYDDCYLTIIPEVIDMNITLKIYKYTNEKLDTDYDTKTLNFQDYEIKIILDEFTNNDENKINLFIKKITILYDKKIIDVYF